MLDSQTGARGEALRPVAGVRCRGLAADRRVGWMALKFTVESFLNLIRQSRLVDGDELDRLVAGMSNGGDSQLVADSLVASGALTPWQADKLLKGKHKGFFLGKYRLQSLLGKGGMSSVYLAEHVLMRRRCAIKVLPHKKVADSSYLERFHREAQAVASLDHPNIVRAYDVDREVDGSTEIHFLVMEYVEGHNLQDLVVVNGSRGFREVADFIRQSARGLSHAHEAGLVHRDIKPANLLVDTEGVVKILDLGLARFFEEEDEDPITLRHDEKVLGTADYLAPEQALDSHKVDARADIYSLGCTMYFLLTARPPFNEGTLAQRLMWHQTKEPPAISEVRPDVPGPLADVVTRMMAKDPDDRFQTATQIADQLTAWLGDALTPGSKAPIAQAVPVAKPLDPADVIHAPEAVPPTAPVIPRVTPTTSFSTAEVVGGESGESIAEVDDPGLADFLSGLGDSPTVSRPAGNDVQIDVPAEQTTHEPTPSPAPLFEVTPPIAAPIAEPIAAPIAAPSGGGFPALDTSVPSLEPRSSTRRRKPSTDDRGRGLGLKIGLVAGGLVLLVVIGMVMSGSLGGGGDSGGSSGEEPGKGSGGGAKNSGGESGGSGGGVVEPVDPLAASKRTLEVGPEARFKTIVSALDFVREHKSAYRPQSRRVQVTINVLGGLSYAESIEIDGTQGLWPTGIEIRSTGVEPAVLVPAAGKPGILLTQVEHISISGFRIDAKSRPVGVVLTGVQDRVALEGLTIDGFTEAGIDARGVAGDPSDDVLRLTGLVLRSGGPGSVGLRFSSATYDTNSHVRILGCRMIGPMRAGLEMTDHVVDLTLQQSVIQSAKVAVLFSGDNRRWRNIAIRNNTFRQVERGLVFEHMPTDSSDNVRIRLNLFLEVAGPECVVETKYAELQFSQMVSTTGAISENWSTRTETADPKKGERELMLPGIVMQRGVQVEFSSTDPLVSDFLEPRDGTLPHRGPGDSKDPTFIGAQPFRQR